MLFRANLYRDTEPLQLFTRFFDCGTVNNIDDANDVIIEIVAELNQCFEAKGQPRIGIILVEIEYHESRRDASGSAEVDSNPEGQSNPTRGRVAGRSGRGRTSIHSKRRVARVGI